MSEVKLKLKAIKTEPLVTGIGNFYITDYSTKDSELHLKGEDFVSKRVVFDREYDKGDLVQCEDNTIAVIDEVKLLTNRDIEVSDVDAKIYCILVYIIEGRRYTEEQISGLIKEGLKNV